MKKLKYIFLLLTVITYSQNAVVQYSKGYINNKTKEIKNLNYELLISENKALMKRVESMEVDNDGFSVFAIKGGGNGVYYKDITNKKRIYQTKTHSGIVNVIKPFTSYEWELLNDSKIICGYTCYKATTTITQTYYLKSRKKENKTETIIAWYTPQINLSFGPLDIDGLPGLVLQVFKNDVIFTANKIVLNQNKKIVIKEPVANKTITEKEYDIMIQNVVNFVLDRKK